MIILPHRGLLMGGGPKFNVTFKGTQLDGGSGWNRALPSSFDPGSMLIWGQSSETPGPAFTSFTVGGDAGRLLWSFTGDNITSAAGAIMVPVSGYSTVDNLTCVGSGPFRTCTHFWQVEGVNDAVEDFLGNASAGGTTTRTSTINVASAPAFLFAVAGGGGTAPSNVTFDDWRANTGGGGVWCGAGYLIVNSPETLGIQFPGSRAVKAEAFL